MRAAALCLLGVWAVAPRAQGQDLAGLRNPGRITLALSDTMGTPFPIALAATGSGVERVAPVMRALAALSAVYADLKIAAVADSISFAVGNQAFTARAELAGRRMSLWLECGEGMTGPWADAYKIQISLISFLRPDPDGVVLRTSLLATAVNVTEGANPTQMCRTSGELERKIDQLVEKKLGVK